MMHGREKSICHSSWEADEQSGFGHSGAGGAKGGGRGEREPAKHAPDTVPETRVTGAGARTASATTLCRHIPRLKPCAGIPLAQIWAGGGRKTVPPRPLRDLPIFEPRRTSAEGQAHCGRPPIGGGK